MTNATYRERVFLVDDRGANGPSSEAVRILGLEETIASINKAKLARHLISILQRSTAGVYRRTGRGRDLCKQRLCSHSRHTQNRSDGVVLRMRETHEKRHDTNRQRTVRPITST